MEGTPKAKDMRPTFENFIVGCPWCGRENIFNRASDLKNFGLIDYLEVSCLFADCARPFYLNGDIINPAYEMIIFDCYELLERKHYSYCVLNLAQAFEVFFSHYLRVELVYRPFALDPDRDIDQFKELMQLLYRRLRNLFFCLVLQARHPASLREAESVIRVLAGKLDGPSDDDIRNGRALADKGTTELLLRLKYSTVAELRNRVVHQGAYRPTLDEVNSALEETRAILFPLARALEVHVDNVNWYMRQRT
jgi:hypothetical protein